MNYYLQLFDWSLYTLPGTLSQTDIETDSHANDPAHPDYSSGAPTWIGEDYTYNGGAATRILIDDDDPDFQDGYVETGGIQTLAEDVTINGTLYTAGSQVQNEFSMVDASGNEVWVLAINGTNIGFVYPTGQEPTAGDTFTPTNGRDGAPADSGDGVASSEPYSTVDERDGTVTGSEGDDTIDASYTADPEGDQVDDGWAGGTGTNDNVIDALGGDDVVDAGLGNDTVYAGNGADTVEGGSGNDTIDLTADGASSATVGRWDFDDAGDPLDDFATPDNDAVLRGDATHDAATGSVALDGTGDYVEIADDPAYDLSSATIVMDFQLDTLTGVTGLFTKDALNNADGDLTVYANANGSIFLRWQSDTTSYSVTTSSGVIQTGVDHALQVSLDADTGDIDLYVDGTLEGSVNAPGATLQGNVNPWVVGGRGWASTRGTADDVNATIDGSVSRFEVFDDAYTPTGLEELGDGEADTIVFSDSDGDDTVSGFEAPIDNGDGTYTGLDQLDLSGLTDAGGNQLNTRDITVGDDGFGNALLSFPNGESITLVGIAPADVTDEDALAAMGVPMPDDIVEGTAGADTIDVNYTGDPEGDAVDAGDNATGNDDDVIRAGAGNDSADGNNGNDTIFGQDGDDTLLGGAGDDSLDGDDVADGDDSLDGGAGNDTLVGDGGNDTLLGGDGNDEIYASGGDNLIDGGDGSDQVFAGSGNDTITVDQGDTVLGAGGDDVFDLRDLDTTGTGNADIDITGGETGETNGDTLILTSDVSYGDITFDNEDDDAGGLSGSFQMSDGTDVTFREIENIICFTPGTRILTGQGERPIETLRVGDLVVTRDQGLRPIRWIGRRTVRGRGKFAPIRVGANALDSARAGLLVSPQHRILFTGYRAELLFGDPEVLVPAKHLVDGQDVVEEPCEAVTYIHIMFDHHEVIYAEGIATESFHAGDMGLEAVAGPAREELFAIFPELRSAPGHHLETARLCLKRKEARLLVGTGGADEIYT